MSPSSAINLMESSIDGALMRESPNYLAAIEAEVRLDGDNEKDDLAKARLALQHHVLAVYKAYTILDVGPNNQMKIYLRGLAHPSPSFIL
ncbi:uncharacterized protein A4U43_C08F27000 [Asparagus officinalis]|nr:uncharacterized protein A4U43_C08F27000 [Asparagus officinalis]